MPRRRSTLAITLATHGRRELKSGYFIWFCAAALLAGCLWLPLTSDAQKVKGPSAPVQKQRSSQGKKPISPNQQGGSKERGITNTEAPEFKADTPASALVIGISSYPNLPSESQLRYAHSDAQAIRDFLVSEKGGFRSEDVKLLLNEDATQDQIMREIGILQERTGPGSLALIFFAGHGFVNKSNQAFLIASDTKAGDLHATGIDMQTLNSTVQNMRARSVVIITDACHSGTLGDFLKAGPLENISAKYFERPSQRIDQSSFIFSAASPKQASIEDSNLRAGLFTHLTLQGLQGAADDNTDGIVTSQELYSYVQRTMSIETRKRDIAQSPEHNPGYDLSIPLAIVSEAGRERYKQWFKEDARFAFLLAAFNEAMEDNRLTLPDDHSAWDYLTKLTNNPGTPVGVAREKEELFLRKVISEADKVIEVSPNDPRMWAEAAGNLEKAFQLKGKDKSLRAKQYFCELMSLKHSGDIGGAERKCDQTLDLIEREGASDHSVTIKIAQFYRELGRWEKANGAYGMAKNKSASEVTEYAEVFVKLNSYVEAEEQLRQALRLNADYKPALIMLGDLLLRNGTITPERMAEALTHGTRALQLAPEDLDAEEVVGRAHLAMNDTRRAIDSLIKVARSRRQGENRNRALSYLSESYHRAGDLDRAISALREAEASNSATVEIFDTLAERLGERGNVRESIIAAEKAASLTRGQPQHAQRVYKVAEYLERAADLENAAHKYKEAAALTSDSRLRTAWETHGKVLFLRIGRNADANVPRAASVREQDTPWQSAPINIPGGLDALRQLTGLTINSEDKSALARVFDACLRNPELRKRLIDFYREYPNFARKVGMGGDDLSGAVNILPPGQPSSIPAREVLKFFGIEDKKGIRQIKPGQFDARRYMLEALGGDAVKLKNGEPVRITIRNEELALVHGFETWVPVLKDKGQIKQEEQLLVFLNNPQAMKLYVGLSVLPEQAINDLRSAAFREKQAELAESVYFAAPYFRFDQRGKLNIPGGGPGELNWRRALKVTSNMELMHSLLFLKENRGALYLFCALSSTGEVGEALSNRRTSFEIVFNLFRNSNVLVEREPFDFIDLLAHLRIENGLHRVPKVIEFWQQSVADTRDPAMRLLSQLGKVSAGGPIPLVKQIAVLAQVERERPDWATHRPLVERIASLTTANKESQLETALDMEMTTEQLIAYLDLVDRIEALPVTPAKTTVVRSFQATFELLRYLAKNSSLPESRISHLTDLTLRIDPARTDYALHLVSFLASELFASETAPAGAEVETKLIALLTYSELVELPADNPKGSDAKTALLLDTTAVMRERISKFLAEQKHTRLSSVIDAIRALEDLEKNPSATESLAKLKAAVREFAEVEAAPDPKKKKSKVPVVPDANFKDSVSQLAAPIERSAINTIRERIALDASEALLAHVYAVSAYPKRDGVVFRTDLVRTHDFTSLPWAPTRITSDGKISGNLTRLNQAMARVPATIPTPSIRTYAFVDAMMNSFHVLGRRWVTGDAVEFVARTLDLGEDVLALYKQGDESAAGALNQLDFLMGQRRSILVKAGIDRADMTGAVRAMTPSELYALGRIYLDQQMANASLDTLKNEPGSLGVLARLVARYQTRNEQGIPGSLLRGINQVGMSTSSLTGLNRLGILWPDPYEYAAGFRDDSRLTERVQDLKLVLARRAHRLGGNATFPFNLLVAESVLSHTITQTMRSSRGASPPGRDWQSLLAAIQALTDDEFARLVTQVVSGGHVRSVTRNSWNDLDPAERNTGVDSQPKQ